VATRRKYRSRPDPIPADNGAAAAAQASPVAPGQAAGGDGASPLQAALQAQQHAEHLQRQHATRAHVGLPEPPIDAATRQAIGQHVDSMNLSAHKKRFLMIHTTLLTEPYNRLMAHAYQARCTLAFPILCDGRCGFWAASTLN
jgi:hypothetical protein